MTSRPAPTRPASAHPENAQVNPDHEYEEATESKLDHTRPPQHDKTAMNRKQTSETQISVGKP